MARAEPARDGVFCVFAEGVCSLSMPANIKAIVLPFSQHFYAFRADVYIPEPPFIY
ncbi:hypothetical protein ACJ2_38030 [Pantoea sp. QMID2]|nr:hypothetical protein ACJ1_35380 [Pantoea sp. QMID1]GME44495.1 hypothetical protein ACJ3_35590 [Pantoea sp. QMID3]GME60081.1 hypothetical protein ACJ4_35480 [Pantoea sp. QMID4]GME62384.1 hypothetical protein ACJ2_38030 [Pantoea sp. QMID2]